MTDPKIADAIAGLNALIVNVERTQTVCYKSAGNIREMIAEHKGSEEDKQILAQWKDWFEEMAVSLNKFVKLSYEYPKATAKEPDVNVVKVADKDAN